MAAEAQAVPMELEIDRINAVTRNLREGDQEDKEFERRMRVADTLLKERQVKGKENVDRQRTPSSPEPSRQVSPAPMAGVSRLETPTRGNQ